MYFLLPCGLPIVINRFCTIDYWILYYWCKQANRPFDYLVDSPLLVKTGHLLTSVLFIGFSTIGKNRPPADKCTSDYLWILHIGINRPPADKCTFYYLLDYLLLVKTGHLLTSVLLITLWILIGKNRPPADKCTSDYLVDSPLLV